MPSQINNFISEDNNLIIIVDGIRFYEFRDLTPRDVLWIDHQFESDNEFDDKEKFKDSLNFLAKLLKRLIVYANSDIFLEDWKDFIKINKIVQENIMSSRLGWHDFLGFVFAAGNKSFIGIPSFIDLPLTQILDMYDVLMEYFEQQKSMMDEAEGRVR